MTSARDIAVKRGETVLYFNPGQLVLDPQLNIRDMSTPDNDAHVEWLCGEILDKGFTSIMKVLVRENDSIVVTEGHCRLTAVRRCIERGQLQEDVMLPCLTEPKGTSLLDLYARQFSTNGTSKGLNADEAAANIKRIMTFGKSQAEVARIIGKSAQYVGQMLGFQEAPQEVREMVAKGEVSTSAAMATLRKEGPSKGAAKLKAGVSKAKAAGRKKATQKDIAPRKVVARSDTAVILDRKLVAKVIKALLAADEDDLVDQLRDAVNK
jgi:hypothetical protein